MAKVSKKKFTMQGRDTPVSAAGQGGKAGPQASSSGNRSFSLVGDLASGKLRATRRSHNCQQDTDNFCYVCSNFEIVKNRRKLSEANKNLYFRCFNMSIVNEDKPWVPNSICCTCLTMMNRFEKTKNSKCLKFAVPTIWRKPRSEGDCYFCQTNIIGFNAKNKSSIQYPNISSVTRPIISSSSNNNAVSSSVVNDDDRMEIDRHEEKQTEKEEEDEENMEYEDSQEEISDEEYIGRRESKGIRLFDQESLSDFIRRLGAPKDMAEYIAAEMKDRGFVKKGTKSSFYRNREKEFRKYYAVTDDDSLVYCKDIQGLMNEMKPNVYIPDQWRLFIDSSVRSLKAVLLHNGNVYASIPIAHSTKLKEEYDTIKFVLDKIKYSEHKWQICGDLKIITMMLGQQSGFTKYSCFLCLWDSRARKKHYTQKNWETRKSLDVGKYNVVKQQLVDPAKILLPPLHIKLGLMKQFVKALDKNGNCFQYLMLKFTNKSEAKIKEGIFDGPEIRKCFRDEKFPSIMTEIEKAAWFSFRDVSEKFLGKGKGYECSKMVEDMVNNFQKLGCLMNLKLHFLDSHLDYFPENICDYSEEQGERFHQDLKEMERRYQGRWDINMLADYCWMLKRDTEESNLSRNQLRRSFEIKRTRYHRKK